MATTYDNDMSKQADLAHKAIIDKLKLLQDKKREFDENAKRAFETDSVQEVNASMGAIFKDGISILNSVIDRYNQVKTKSKIENLQKKDALITTMLEEWSKHGQLTEEGIQKIKDNGLIKDAKAFLKDIDKETEANPEFKSALKTIVDFDESVTEALQEKEKQKEKAQEQSEDETQSEEQSYKQTQKQNNRNRSKQRQKA